MRHELAIRLFDDPKFNVIMVEQAITSHEVMMYQVGIPSPFDVMSHLMTHRINGVAAIVGHNSIESRCARSKTVGPT
jgi:hypothetical protein